jgi:hypothetical protein
MFVHEDRDRIRNRVLALARDDRRISGGAVTGSYVIGAEDHWSDVDTAFGYREGVDPRKILDDWTRVLETELNIVHSFDLSRGETHYRVFLLSSTLEVDISLTPADSFGAHGPTFRLVFGQAIDPQPASGESPDEVTGWGWIYLFSARAAIERMRLWQALRFVDAARDHGLALACLREGVPSSYARGVHLLSEGSTAPWSDSLVKSLDPAELSRALAAVARAYLLEIQMRDPRLADRLIGPLSALT